MVTFVGSFDARLTNNKESQGEQVDFVKTCQSEEGKTFYLRRM